MTPSDYIALIFINGILVVMALWTIDISFSAVASNGVMTNGFRDMNPIQMYHLALYLLVVNLTVMGIIAIHFIMKDK